MKKILLLSALAFLIPSLCHARIGETLNECIARYGPMLDIVNATGKFNSEYPQHRFQFESVLILIRFVDGRSVQEEFTSYRGLTPEKRTEIIESNSKKTTGIDVIVVDKSYQESDKITVTTREFDAIIRADKGGGF